MDCTVQIQHWFYLCLVLCGLILALLAMFFGYNLKLDKRTVKLEKKNGHELDRIVQLETKNDTELRKLADLEKRIKELEEK